MSGIYNLPDSLLGAQDITATSGNSSHEDEHITFLINRAYQNIYGMNMPSKPSYRQPIYDAVQALYKDARCSHLSDKIFMQACEDIIRICDEHHRKAEQHRARANNPLYLRETALDNALEKQRYYRAVGELMPDSAVVIGKQNGQSTELEGRLRNKNAQKPSSSEIMELAYQQLSLNAHNANS